jgi:hypothetical protein
MQVHMQLCDCISAASFWCATCEQGMAPAPVQALPRGGYGVQLPQLSEAERQRSAAAMQQRFGGDPVLANSIGARLLGKMGFGASEDSKGGLGRNEHVRPCC